MSGGTHLTLEERERLAALKAEGLSLRAIARALGRTASTISRELRRNALPKGGHLPVHAEGCYRERRQRPDLKGTPFEIRWLLPPGIRRQTSVAVDRKSAEEQPRKRQPSSFGESRFLP